MLSKDREENLKKSFYKFLYERLSANYYLIYSASQDEELEKRIKRKAPSDYWKWINLNWLIVGQGIFCVAKAQLNCNTIIVMDKLKDALGKMVCDVQEELNIDSIPILDFSSDPLNPEPIDNVLIPRFRGSRAMPDAAGDTVNVEALDYDIHVWRESVLP